MPKGETGRSDVFGHCQAKCKINFAKQSGTKWQLFGPFCATPAFPKTAHDACADHCFDADYVGYASLKSLLFTVAQTEDLCHAILSF